MQRPSNTIKNDEKIMGNHAQPWKRSEEPRKTPVSSPAPLGFETLFDGLALLVLDECDRLLARDQAADLEALMKFLPPSPRQNLLLSATVPEEVRLLRPFFRPKRHSLMDP